jgi:hypothetical protein
VKRLGVSAAFMQEQDETHETHETGPIGVQSEARREVRVATTSEQRCVGDHRSGLRGHPALR